MPTYLYICQTEHGEFEEFHSINDKLEECPMCAEKGIKSPVQRLINAATKGQVQLTGQDLIDKVNADAKVLSKEIHSNENLYANVLSPDRYQAIQTQLDKNKRNR